MNFLENCKEVLQIKNHREAHLQEGEITILESTLILNRAALQPRNVTEMTSICRDHKRNLGKSFNRMATKTSKCACPKHEIFGKGKKVDRQLDFGRSQELLRKCDFNIAFNDWICKDCSVMITQCIKDAPEPPEQQSPMIVDDDDDISPRMNAVKLNTGEESSEGFDGKESDSSQSVGGSQKVEARYPRLEVLNKFLRDSGCDLRHEKRLTRGEYDGVSPQYRRTLQRGLSTTIVTALRSMADSVDNQNKIFQDTVRSQRVEKELGLTAVAPDDLVDVITAYNGLSSYLEKRQVLSLVVDRYSWPFLKLFNKNQAGDQTKICWERTLTHHQYKKAKLHKHYFGYGMAKIVKEARRCTRVDELVIDAIFDYITSHKVTQQVAFGKFTFLSLKVQT